MTRRTAWKLDKARVARSLLPFPTDVVGAVALLGGLALWAVLTPKQRPAPLLTVPLPPIGTSKKTGTP